MTGTKFTGIAVNQGFAGNLNSRTSVKAGKVEVLASWDYKAGSLNAQGEPRKVDASGIVAKFADGQQLIIPASAMALAQHRKTADLFDNAKFEGQTMVSGELKEKLVFGIVKGMITGK